MISLCTLPKAIPIRSTRNNKTLHNILHQFTKNFKSEKKKNVQSKNNYGRYQQFHQSGFSLFKSSQFCLLYLCFTGDEEMNGDFL